MNNPTSERPIRVGLISLGCAKNLVDAEIMLGSLMKGGIEITSDAAEADVLIVNTCSFIDAAQEESVDTILQSAEVREAHNRGQGLVVSGCLPQRFRDELPKLLPEVDAFMGIDQVAQVTKIVTQALQRRRERVGAAPTLKRSAKPAVMKRIAELDKAKPASEPLIDVNLRPTYIPDFATPRFRLTPRHFAYVKIAEGCNHPCSFCIIPRMRGSHRSRTLDDIVHEARNLIAEGGKELNLISQDSTYYGLDLRPNHSRNIAAPEKFRAAAQSADTPTLCTLLRALNALPGNFWIRLLYTHPAHWTDELIETIAECPKVARYVDMPLQHIHGNMLERMRRETSQEYIVDLIKRIRAGVPGIALRTTFIVGFPGETERYFDTLLDFIREARFERLGVFTYSQEEATRAARMDNQVPDKVKRQRRNIAMAAQHEVAVSISESFVGKTIKVLIEKEATTREIKGARISSWEHGLLRGKDRNLAELRGSYLIARGEADAPDIDGRVYVRGSLPVGNFAQVKIVGHTDYDLIAEPLGRFLIIVTGVADRFNTRRLRRDDCMNLPNKLTLSRFILTVGFLAVFFAKFQYHQTVALAFFVAASLTDYFDGMIARRDKMITNFGILMDPLADKILVCSAFIAFVDRGSIPAWMALIVVARELAITGLRLLAASKNLVLAAERYGKHKTISQIVAIVSVLVVDSYEQWGILGRIFGWEIAGEPWSRWFTTASLWVAVVLTFVSGSIYLWRNRALYLEDM